jgi:hypothetical protein
MLAQQQQQISREKAHQQQGLSPVTILSRYLLLGFLLVLPGAARRRRPQPSQA